jgi:hypothetical protein
MAIASSAGAESSRRYESVSGALQAYCRTKKTAGVERPPFYPKRLDS